MRIRELMHRVKGGVQGMMMGFGVERRQQAGSKVFDKTAEGVGMAVGDKTEEREGMVPWVVGGQEFEDEGLYKMREKNGS